MEQKGGPDGPPFFSGAMITRQELEQREEQTFAPFAAKSGRSVTTILAQS